MEGTAYRKTLKKLSLTFSIVVLMVMPVGLLTGSTEGGDGQDGDSPTRDWLDIAIENIELERETQSGNVYPGQTVTINVLLYHDDRPYESSESITSNNRFTTVLVVDDGYDNVSVMHKDITSMSHLVYVNPRAGNPGNSYKVSFQWDVPEHPPEEVVGGWPEFQFKVSATITVDDDDKSDNYRTGAGIRVNDPEFAPFIWEEGQFEGVQDGPIHEVEVGAILNIPFKLINDGNNVDIIGIEFTSVPEGWKPEPFDPEGFQVFPQDELDLELALYVSPSNILAQYDESKSYDYVIRVTTYSLFYPDGATNGAYLNDPFHIHNFRFKMKPKPNVYLVPQEYQYYFEPNDEKNYDVKFDLTNTGNYVNRFAISTPLSPIDVSNGWEAKPQSKITGDVDPGQTIAIIIKVKVPSSAPHFYNINLIVRAKSQLEIQNFEKESVACQVLASTRYAGDIQEFSEPIVVSQGREYTVNFNFTNRGNDKDPNQELYVTYRPKGWSVDIDQNELKRQRGIGPRTTVVLPMTVFIPEGTTSGKWKVTVEAKGGPTGRLLDTATFEFFVSIRHKVGLTAVQREKVGFIGGQVEYMVNVQNLGSWIDSYNLSIENDWAELELDRLEVYPGDTRSLKVWVDVPQDAGADSTPDTKGYQEKLFPDGIVRRVYDPYEIKITAYSQNETKKENTLVHLNLLLYVTPYYDFEIEVDPEEKPLQFSTDHNQDRVVKIRVTNKGNIGDLVRFSWVDNPYDWIRFQKGSVEVPFNGYSHALISITPRAYTMEVGVYELEMRGESTRDPDTPRRTRTYDLELIFFNLIFDITEVRVNNEPVDRSDLYSGERDTRYSFQVSITNNGNVNLTPIEFNTLFAVLYDGPYEMDRVNITYLPVGENVTVIFSWKAATPGPHPMTVKLEGEVPISDQGESERPVSIRIAAPPVRDGTDEELTPSSFLIPLILMLLFGLLVFVFIYRFNQIDINVVETGYDETGEYRPWAIKEKLKGEEERELPKTEEKETLPEVRSAPQLPPAPAPASTARQAPTQPSPRPPLQAGQPQARPVVGQQTQARPPQAAMPHPGRPIAPPMRPPSLQTGAPQARPAAVGRPMPPQGQSPQQVARPPQQVPPNIQQVRPPAPQQPNQPPRPNPPPAGQPRPQTQQGPQQ